MRGRVCNLPVLLLLFLARSATLWSQSRTPHDYILLSHMRFPQLGGPGPRIYIPQEQGGPVISAGTGFPFHRLLRLAELRWKLKLKLNYERHSVSQSVLVSAPIWDP
jgi:hypothetical protein